MKQKEKNTSAKSSMPSSDHDMTTPIQPQRPRFEVIACVANCAGLPGVGVHFTFDLRDNQTSYVYRRLLAMKHDGEWNISGLWPEELPDILEADNVPVLADLAGKRTFVPGSRDDYWNMFKAVSPELDRWSRNLFSIVEREAGLDRGMAEYKNRLQSIDRSEHQSPLRWPLRP
jgi:hypothetical protein